MSKCRRKVRKGKSIHLSALGVSASDRVYVGLDVHKRSIHVGVLINNSPVRTFVIPPNPSRVIEFLRPLEAGLVRIVYEAGPTGYGLARAFQEIGWPIEIVAPGKIDRPVNRGSKSDRLDCTELAQLSKEKDKLKIVAIPTVQEEEDRQIIRLREQIKKKEKRVKQQIKSLLLQYGIEAPPGLSRWNQAGIKALSALEISPDLRYMLICSDHGFEADRREHDPYGFYLIRSERFSGGRKDIPITGIAPSILKILGLDDELGVPVARDKVEIKTGKLKEIKQRLKALGYI